MPDQAPLWTCCRCDRSFANRNQIHSCRPLSDLESHFVGKDPKVRTIFDRLVSATERFGPFQVTPEKTRIAFHNRMSFAAYTPRRTWLGGHVVLSQRLENPRFRSIEEYSPHNIVHAFRLGEPSEVDDEVTEWLRLAYEVGAQHHLRR